MVEENGKMEMAFEGFEGKTCFDQARSILDRMKRTGVDVAVDEEIPTSSTAVAERQKAAAGR